MTSYRFPNETIIFWATMLLLLGVLAVAAGVSACIAPLIVAGMLVLSFYMNKQHHQSLLREGKQVDTVNSPRLNAIAQQCVRRLRSPRVEFFVIPSRQMNAYTFGLSEPNAVVLFDCLFNYMDEDELRFIIGHELGHVSLGHSWLNTLLGGMAGVPVSLEAAVILTLAFRGWNRACEFSCDRAGLLACGSVDKAISALIKLQARDADTPQELDAALRQIDAEDDNIGNVLANTLSTHPMLIKRINELRSWAATEQYRRLQAQAFSNAG